MGMRKALDQMVLGTAAYATDRVLRIRKAACVGHIHDLCKLPATVRTLVTHVDSHV